MVNQIAPGPRPSAARYNRAGWWGLIAAVLMSVRGIVAGGELMGTSLTNAAAAQGATPLLTSAEEVHRLTREEAQRPYRAVIRGVVICPLPQFGKRRFKGGDTIKLASTFFSHARADRVDWQGTITLCRR